MTDRTRRADWRTTPARVVTRLLGTPPVAATARRLVRSPLRIVVYHDVTDRRLFELQLSEILSTVRTGHGRRSRSMDERGKPPHQGRLAYV